MAANKAVNASTPAGSGKTSPSLSGGKSSPAPTAAEAAAQKREADAVAKEQEEEIDDTTLEELYGKVCTEKNKIPKVLFYSPQGWSIFCENMVSLTSGLRST